MKIGLIDTDGNKKFPNLPLMKISAYEKSKGNEVKWCVDKSEHFDKVYQSKVFSFTKDLKFKPNTDELIKGGTGYCISSSNNRESYNKDLDSTLPPEIEHIYPDYSIYGDLTKDTAYGFLTRGCPRGIIHDYCIVGKKEGLCSHKVAELGEFYKNQKYIEVMDSNILACSDSIELMEQLAASKAWINFNQGLDIQLLKDEHLDMFKKMKLKRVHFAWDNYEDKDIIVPKLEKFRAATNYSRNKVSVYVLINYNTTLEQDLERIYFIRSLGYQPYPMFYNKGEFFYKNGVIRKDNLKQFSEEQIEHAKICQKIQRWCSPFIFWSCDRFEDYKAKGE